MTLLPWVVVALMVSANALYVAAEFAAVAAQRSLLAPLAREGNRRAAALLAVLEDGAALDRYIAACQIGITLSSLVAGAYGQATIGVELGTWLRSAFDLGDTSAQTIAFISVLLCLTTLQVVLGELVPKSFALQFPERTALATFVPLRWSVWFFRPFIWFLNGSGFLLLKPFGVVPGGHQHVHSPEEIALLLADSRRGGGLSDEAHRRLDRGLQLSTHTVRRMMTPRSKLYAIDVAAPETEQLQRVIDSPHGQLPVYRGSLDAILGSVSVKDVVGALAAEGQVPQLEALMRPLPVVPDTLPALALVRLLQERRSSKAIVVDEHGSVQGIISIEDVIAELFGAFGDELKEPALRAEELPDGAVRLPGGMVLEDARTWVGARWQSEASTVGEHVVASLGRMPTEGEQVEVDGVTVTIAEAGPAQIRSIIVAPPPTEAAPPGLAAEGAAS